MAFAAAVKLVLCVCVCERVGGVHVQSAHSISHQAERSLRSEHCSAANCLQLAPSSESVFRISTLHFDLFFFLFFSFTPSVSLSLTISVFLFVALSIKILE